jgi:hypothetical protein
MYPFSVVIIKYYMEQDSISLRQSSTKYILLHGTANKIITTRISYYRDNQAQLESTIWTKSKILIQSDPIFLLLTQSFISKKLHTVSSCH